MWVRLGLVAGRILLRLLIRLAPFLAIGLVGLARCSRWPLYYRTKALNLGRFRLSAVPMALLGLLAGLLLLGVALYVIQGQLAPQ